MLSEIRKIISDNHDRGVVSLLFWLVVVTIIYEFCIGVSESYYLSIYDIIPRHHKTDCEKKLSFLEMYCFCDFSSAIFSFVFSFSCLGRNESYKNLKSVVMMMIGPQIFQIIFAYVYLAITIEMESSCRDKLKTDAPEIWTIAIIHIITSCIFFLILFVILGAWVICYCSRRWGRDHADRLQIQEAILNSDPESSQNNHNIV